MCGIIQDVLLYKVLHIYTFRHGRSDRGNLKAGVDLPETQINLTGKESQLAGRRPVGYVQAQSRS